MVAAALPDLDQLDAEALKALLIAGHNQLLEQRATLAALHAELDEHRQTLTAQSEQLRSSSERIEHLKLLVDKMRRMIFGSKSEKVVVQLEQLEFQLEDLEATQAEAEAMADAAAPANAPAREQKARPARKPLPSHLPREVVSHLPEGDCCPDCGGALRSFGEDVTEQLEYIPESFKVTHALSDLSPKSISTSNRQGDDYANDEEIHTCFRCDDRPGNRTIDRSNPDASGGASERRYRCRQRAHAL
jgi:DNA repair exonuclease SbcCD ATPase subunit